MKGKRVEIKQRSASIREISVQIKKERDSPQKNQTIQLLIKVERQPQLHTYSLPAVGEIR